MPFCTQCGNQVQDKDVFCERCGRRQGPAATKQADPLSGITPRAASILCYVPWIGWVASIIVLASARFRPFRSVRFHAFQGLYLFVAWLMVDWVVKPFFHFMPGSHFFRLPNLLHAILLGAAIFMIVKVNQEDDFHLPVLGELAERSVAEQR